MIGTIRKHQAWLWYAVIGATIFSFVAYFNPASRYNKGQSGDGSAYSAGSIFGEPVTGEQLAIALNEARIFYRLNANEWPTSEAANQKVLEIAHQFLLVDAELRRHHIEVTPEAAARFTKQIAGLKPTDALSKEMLDQMMTKLLAGANGEITPDDFVRFVHISAGQQYLVAIFGMTGQLITPKEAESFYRREHEPMVTEMVTFSPSRYFTMIIPSTNEIADFYNKRQAQYRVPERLQLNYVEFSATNFMAAGDLELAHELGITNLAAVGDKEMAKQLATNIDQRVDEMYVQQDPAAFKDETGTNQLSAAAAKAKIKSQLRLRAALFAARKEASDFAVKLIEGKDEKHPFSPSDLTQLASFRSLTVKTTEPFDEHTGPSEIELAPRDLRMVFALRDDDPEDKDKSRLYISSPIVTEKGVFVVGLKKRLPSHLVPLAEIHDQVVTDFKRAKAIELSRQAGQKFEEAAKGSWNQGKTFADLCASQSVTPIALPAFSLSTPSVPQINDRTEFQQIQSVAFTVPVGKVSPFVPTAEGGFVVYVKQRLPVDDSKMGEELPLYLSRMREQRQVAAFQQWLNREYQLHAAFATPKPAAAG